MMMTHFKMGDEKLIECVSEYEFLYNIRHPKYMDSLKKEIAWKEIAKQLKQPAGACKQRWQGLRDSYRRALNKRKGKGGQTSKIVKLWKYENEMAFLTPFLTEKKSQGSVEIASDDEASDKGDESHAFGLNVPENPNTEIEIEETAAVDFGVANSIESIDDIEQNNMLQHNQINRKIKAVKRKTVDSEQSASAMLMAKLLDDLSECEPPRGQDEIDRFFLNISDTVKRFSPYLQAVAKNKIFNLVSEMELQQLAPPSHTI